MVSYAFSRLKKVDTTFSISKSLSQKFQNIHGDPLLFIVFWKPHWESVMSVNDYRNHTKKAIIIY